MPSIFVKNLVDNICDDNGVSDNNRNDNKNN